MKFYKYKLLKKWQEVETTYIYQFLPENEAQIDSFKPGQYIFMKQSNFRENENHPFSIASSPNETILEFCIKIYGNWTKKLSEINKGQSVWISEPQGDFIWDTSIKNAVFLLGGIGISPIMSILRFIKNKKLQTNSLQILYGNRTPQTVAYRKDLDLLQQNLPLKVVNIYSDLPKNDFQGGYRGFITREIVEKEVDLSLKPTFFIIGPPIFIEKMDLILADLNIDEENIKKEKIIYSK